MARAKAKTGRASATPRATRRSTRNRQLDDAPNDRVPDVFREMLTETTPSAVDEPPPLKKRKLEKVTESAASQSPLTPSLATRTTVDTGDNDGEYEDTPRLQTIIDESESDDSDIDWEDVNLDQDNADYLLQPLKVDQEEEILQIEVGNGDARNKPARARRKAATTAERAMRLHVHKMHVLCLLYHSHIRNAWCNDNKVQASLKRFRSVQINTYFMPNPDQSQLQAAKSFIDGLTLARDAWKKFKITSLGIRRAKWALDAEDLEVFKIPETADPVMEVSDLRKAAIAFEGSADTGAMLFCAFLRALGVEARLICSLQPLPFAAIAQPPVETTPKGKSNVVYAENDRDGKATPSSEPAPLKRITRIGRPGLSSSSTRQAPVPSLVKPKKSISHPRYPVYWVEAFNAAQQKWITVDPIATGTIGKPSRLEPPLSDPDVSMAYVVAFEDDGVAKDVTRRYVKAYNAKTRKARVESTENGARWWRKAMKLFKRRTILDRDQLEDAELSRREAQEEMPKNIQDFKDHPYYVLPRHLRHNEAIHPLRSVGQINVGTAATTNLEPIYRRRDVHTLKTADKWYRLGRDVKPGEQPLKHAKPRRSRQQRSPFADDDDEEEELGRALYAPFQTTPYIPPPCTHGRVPRNAFGNLDVYVPSMVPAGGTHVRSPQARHAARLLGIDHADAVTGFTFRGRHGTAVVEGVVVAAEYAEAVGAVIEGFGEVEAEEERERRRAVAVGMWRRFLAGLRVVERVRGYASKDEREEMDREVRERIEAAEIEEVEAEKAGRGGEMAGGFLLAEGAGEAPAEPTAGRMLAAADHGEDEYYDGGGGGGFLPEAGASGDEGGPAAGDLFKSQIIDDAAQLRPRIPGVAAEDVLMSGGGFVPDESEQPANDPDDGGGGFIPDEDGGGGFIPEEGGGFIPDEDEGEGAGITDETVVRQPQPAAGNSPSAPTDAHEQKTGGDAAVLESSAATPDEAVHSAMEAREPTAAADHDGAPKTTQSQSNTTEVRPGSVVGNRASSAAAATKPPPPSTVAEPDVLQGHHGSSDEEVDSLPSHDPEDEDAEPEWLAEEVVSD